MTTPYTPSTGTAHLNHICDQYPTAIHGGPYSTCPSNSCAPEVTR